MLEDFWDFEVIKNSARAITEKVSEKSQVGSKFM